MATDAASLSSLGPSQNSAADLTARQVSRFGAIALCLYPLLLIDPIRSLSAVVPVWWTATSLILIVAPGAVMFVSTFVAKGRWTYRAAWAVAIGYAAIFLSFPLVWNGDPTADGTGAWVTPIAGVASVAAAVSMPIPASILYLLVSVTATRLISAAVAERNDTTEFVTDLVWGLSVAAVPFAIAIIALETGRLRDRGRRRTTERSEKTAAEQSRRRERARLDAITHDRVMSIIWAASREGTTPELQRQAVATLEELNALREHDDRHRAVTPVEVIGDLESAAEIVDPGIQVRNSASIDPTTTYPLDVVQAMVSAVSEALHNSVRHAGPEAVRSVALTLETDALTAEVTDDGIGFDENQVPADRLGIALSIRGRMEQIPGGSATIESRPGDGTQVKLSWRRPT